MRAFRSLVSVFRGLVSAAFFRGLVRAMTCFSWANDIFHLIAFMPICVCLCVCVCVKRKRTREYVYVIRHVQDMCSYIYWKPHSWHYTLVASTPRALPLPLPLLTPLPVSVCLTWPVFVYFKIRIAYWCAQVKDIGDRLSSVENVVEEMSGAVDKILAILQKL